jgi:hypothetical protein
MENEDVEDRIHRQIVEAQAELEAQRCRGENTEGTLLLLRSLRLSLRSFSGGIDPDDEAATTFVLSVSSDGKIFLRRDHHLAQLDSGWLTTLFCYARVALAPGQSLLIEPEFARRAVEEALGDVLAEERAQKKQRADFQTALKQSSGPWKRHLLQELCLLDLRIADLPLRLTELLELHGVASGMTRDRASEAA